MVGHWYRLIVDKGHLKMTVSGQKPSVSDYSAVKALGIAEYYLERPLDGVNLRVKDLRGISTTMTSS